MPRRLATLLAVGGLACGGGPPNQPLYAAGSEKDDGHGVLARASARLLTSDLVVEDPLPTPPRTYDEGYGGDGYGGAMYGGGAYGGASYASYVPPRWGYPDANRIPPYSQKPGLVAAIEGTITWRGPVPKLATSCGPIAPLRIGSDGSVGGVLVYIERVNVGRMLLHGGSEQRPATVGGVVVQRGCALQPSVQLVTPVPAALAIHGDARGARLRITPAGGTPRPLELLAGGRVVMQARTGLVRIESEDGTIGAAWVLGVDTPAYAVTDDGGRFRIDELAPGTYEVTVWQPPIPTVSRGKLAYGEPVLVKRTIKVETGRPARLDVALGR